jgi:hypothetical protein
MSDDRFYWFTSLDMPEFKISLKIAFDNYVSLGIDAESAKSMIRQDALFWVKANSADESTEQLLISYIDSLKE